MLTRSITLVLDLLAPGHIDCPHTHANGTDLTPSWCRAQLDPEGTVASIPTVCITFLGLHFGLVLVHIKDHQARIIHWAVL